MLDQQNRPILDRYWNDFIGKKNLSAASEILAENFVMHDPLNPEPIMGRDRFVAMLDELFRAFPDIRYAAEEEIGDGDKVAIRWTMYGTHAESFLGINPTGRSVTMTGVDILYFAQRHIQALRVETNLLALVHQLGAMPHLGLAF
jgi:steroid delta-isomerase-like uncharacterized protein